MFMGSFKNVSHRACNGTGRIGSNVCRECNGLGFRVVAIKCDVCKAYGDDCTCWGVIMDCNCGGRFAYDPNANCMVCESCGCDPDGEPVWTINRLIWMSWKGSSETPLHFIFLYKGDSVGRYRRYGLLTHPIRGGPFDLVVRIEQVIVGEVIPLTWSRP